MATRDRSGDGKDEGAAPGFDPSPRSLWIARGINLFGLVSPAANLGLVYLAVPRRRWFGFGVGVACAIAILLAFRIHADGLLWTAASVHFLLVVAGLLHPVWVVLLGDLWSAFGRAIGAVVAYPVLVLLYYLVVTPTALLVRLFGMDPLGLRAPRDTTYWKPHEDKPTERYERQF